jgi:pheromone shutdown-related protein TraB
MERANESPQAEGADVDLRAPEVDTGPKLEADTVADAASPYPPEVEILEIDGRRMVLVGTAHISQASVELVRQVIEAERPDAVCVELDPQRYRALAEAQQWEHLDLKQIIRSRQLTTLAVNLLLAAYQRRLGEQFGVTPGRELLEATQTAKALDIPVVLCDRDVRVTLRRAARATPFHRKIMLVSWLLMSLLERSDSNQISKEQLEALKQRDALNDLLGELGEAMPSLKNALIDERDAYLATKIRRSTGQRLVAVVGAGHLQGMVARLRAGEEADLADLDRVPPASPWWKIIGWGIPVMIVAGLAWLGWSQGREVATENLVFWVVVNGVPAALGTAIAFGHPLTVLAALVAAPLTSLSPLIGAGYVAAFVQAWLKPPKVKELETVVVEAGKLSRWWGNRLLRIILVFVLSTLGSAVGTYLGAGKILSSLL